MTDLVCPEHPTKLLGRTARPETASALTLWCKLCRAEVVPVARGATIGPDKAGSHMSRGPDKEQ